MSYAKAGLGRGIGSGLQTMGMMLLDAQDRQEARAFREQQIKNDAADRLWRRKTWDLERLDAQEASRNAAKTAALAEQRRRQEKIAELTLDAENTVARLRGSGWIEAALEPREDGTGWLSGVPRINYGSAPPPEPKYFNTGGGVFTTGDPSQMRYVPGTAPRQNPPPEPEDKWISMGGRRFPNTPEGEEAALAWQRQVREASGSGSGGGLYDSLRAQFGSPGGGPPAAIWPVSPDSAFAPALNPAGQLGGDIEEQRRDWDEAAAVVRANGQSPEAILGPRP